MAEAITAVFNGEMSKYSPEEANGIIQAYLQEVTASKFEVYKAEGEAFLAENAKKEGVHATESGLQYEIIEAGNGAKPVATDTVKVHYHGTLIDGTVFDSSVTRGMPATFGVHQVIKGWTEALQLMPVGSKYRLYIPQDLAYGAQPHPGGAIKPFMALIFDVELISIEA
jgi:FKBP-type peptidyl-prolyl cis-trans isomerase FklB